MAVEANSLKATLRLWGSGVSVVTSIHGMGETASQAGMTVSAFNSLSIDPPMVLVCLNKDATVMEHIDHSRVFAISFLADSQAHISDRFAGRIPTATHAERFHGVETITANTGCPIIGDALAWIDCRLHTQYDGSSHWILIGEVLATGQRLEPTAPLIYYNRGYHTLSVTE